MCIYNKNELVRNFLDYSFSVYSVVAESGNSMKISPTASGENETSMKFARYRLDWKNEEE